MLKACRTCLGLIDVDNLPFHKIEEEDMQLSKESCRYKLLNVIPEMALNITPKSIICAECHSSIEGLFKFKKKCLRTENIITQYFRAKPDVDTKNLDLKDVSIFSMSLGDDTQFTEDAAFVEHVAIKEEAESCHVDEDYAAVDEKITVIRHDVDTYSSEFVEVLRPENKVKEESETGESSDELETDVEVLNYACDYCQKRFKYRWWLNRHLQTHVKPNRCEICDRRFSKKTNLEIHLRTHTGERPYVCSFCGERFASSQNLKDHERGHDKSFPHVCDVCGKGHLNKSHLVEHMRRHTGERPYQCDTCDMKFTTNSCLRKHKRRHAGIRSLKKPCLCVCTLCEKRFRYKSDLKVHMLVHTGERTFQCDTCQGMFATRKTLIAHQKRHTGIRDFECEHCKKRFLDKASLKSHLLIHTKEKPFGCSMCDRRFRAKQSLNDHMRTHTGEETYVRKRERLYPCETCQNKFTSQYNLDKHRKLFCGVKNVESGVKSLVCEYCKKVFKYMNKLKDHTNAVHTKERSFLCGVCERTFYRKSYVAQHIRKQHAGVDVETNIVEGSVKSIVGDVNKDAQEN